MTELEKMDSKKRQRDTTCTVENCRNYSVANNLCASHNMALSRYGNPNGKQKRTRPCANCNIEFSHKYDTVDMCLECRQEKRKKRRADAAKKRLENDGKNGMVRPKPGPKPEPEPEIKAEIKAEPKVKTCILNSPYGFVTVGRNKYMNGEVVVKQKIPREKVDHEIPFGWIEVVDG